MYTNSNQIDYTNDLGVDETNMDECWLTHSNNNDTVQGHIAISIYAITTDMKAYETTDERMQKQKERKGSDV
jgi:hypothetical protein